MTRSDHMPPRLIVMARVPSPGVVKTRLAEELGPREAADLYRDMGAYCVRRMRAAAASGGLRLEIRVDGGITAARAWLGHGMQMRSQREGSLDARLARAFRNAFREGAPAVLAVGTDCPELGGRHVRQALGALQHADVFFGPAEDGGYNLVGIRADVADRGIAAIFGPHIPWSTDEALTASVDAAESFGLSVALGESLADVDRPADAFVWQHAAAERERVRTSPRISVVIPTLEEAEEVAGAIASAVRGGAYEVIVADASASGATARTAEVAGALVLGSDRGRARQLNAGARQAKGDVLVFLHADTRLPVDAADLVRDVLDDHEVALGSFRYGTRTPHDLTDAVIRLGADARHLLFGLPYGDQCQFCRKQDFEDVGGFPDIPTMEDYEFALQMRRLGRVATARGSVDTSTRTWRKHGLARATLVNAGVIAGYRLGVPPERLAGWRARISR